MQVLFDGEMHVAYGFLHLLPPNTDFVDLIFARGGQANGLCGAAQPGVLAMTTGLHTGSVPVRVEALDRAPSSLGLWEEVVEVPLTAGTTQYWLAAFDSGVEVTLPATGSYRVRWSATGMQEAHDGQQVRMDGDPGLDRYLLKLWPAPPAPDAVLRQTSEIAAYWHRVARETPPPPPPPTADELVNMAAAEEAERLAQQQQFDDARELQLWGGRRPTDQLRAIGWPTPQLARRDRELVDRLAALPPDRQRTVARWAARRACEIAGIEGLDWVAEGLSALDRGEPLPGPLNDWSTAWDRLFPGSMMVTSLATVAPFTEQDTPAEDPPIAAESVAISAVQAASDDNPARAVMGAVDALTHGAMPASVMLGEVRAQFDLE